MQKSCKAGFCKIFCTYRSYKRLCDVVSMNDSILGRQSDSDDDLVRQTLKAGAGDRRAFEILVKRYQARVVANCRHITRDFNYAEDLAQEVFVKAFFALNRFEGRSSFKTWLQKIKVNHCLNHLKAKQGKVFVDVDDEALMNAAPELS